jgi:hypothetical protein
LREGARLCGFEAGPYVLGSPPKADIIKKECLVEVA